MTKEAERVVVILDGSKELNPSIIKWPLFGLSLKPGDKLLVLGILHQVINPSTFSFMGAGKLMGFKSKVDTSSIFGTNRRITVEEMGKKLEQYNKDAALVKISEQYKKEQIEFQVKILAGYPLKDVAARAVKSFGATWLVLDRHMKNDQRYFVENLSCNIVRLKKDCNAEELRGPNVKDNFKLPQCHIPYAEMIPAIGPQRLHSPQNREGESIGEHQSHSNRKSISRSSSASSISGNRAPFLSYNEPKSSSSSMYVHDEAYGTTTGPETGGEHSPLSINESGDQKDLQSPDENPKQHNHNDDWMGGNPGDQVFKNSLCLICKNRRPKIGWMRDFTYAELQAATEGFNAKNFLSEGGFGSVYRGEINGMKIAVKQHKYNASLQGEKEFKSEVHVLRTARHENLVMLVGSCSEGNHRLLVYEYVCNRSLDLHLSSKDSFKTTLWFFTLFLCNEISNRCMHVCISFLAKLIAEHSRRPLSWQKRVKIALGTAKGLKYLHDNNIIHRDMRPNNILVTHEFEPLLGDFGLARTQHEDSDKSSETMTRVVGTLGYLAPEYAECGKVSTKTDVYSFGVVLLQLITGMKTTDKRLGGKSLVGWARPLLKDRNYPDLIDQRILDKHDVHQLFWMVRVAEKCLTKDPQKRLSMDKVVFALNYITDCDNFCGIEDFSPAQSDTVSQDSYDSVSQSPFEDDSVFTIETTSANSLSLFNERLPPSPPISSKSSASTLFGESASSSGSNHERYL
ncbi:probable receptor-like protein kinase At2g21480 isoform X3 [Gossypium raimondii]|uniref:probable receptor-like protein kinase At2g21480 isoform X3 n=1 Tax=Gossypium raimondii TaxID=29730 RepID=UPI00063B0960|nr:probable receptor-like protein kinase At2g21480 isoform X3 [Gossypium raimondii]